MSVCINKNSVEYQSLKNKAGIPEFILEAVSRDFMEKYGRLPHLDELPNSNSEPYLRDLLGITKHDSAKVESILEMTGKDTVEEAVIDINNQFRDLETTIVPIEEEALVDIVHRPTDNNFDNWTEEDLILAEAPRDNNGNLLAPNGKVSNLTEKQYALVRTKAFKDWFGDWEKFANITEEELQAVSLIFDRVPELAKIGTPTEYAAYIKEIFPNSVEKEVYWHGSNEDFSEGFASAKRGEGSGALETKKRNDLYLNKQGWASLQYVNYINRKGRDKNGFAHWNKLWWELKEIMSNGRRENNDWKDIVIDESTIRQAIPNKKGVFNRDSGGKNGKWLSERKADYGYENKSDKEFFEEIFGIKLGKDTFNTWTARNAEIFKYLEKSAKGINPVVIDVRNPITEEGQNTYYEEQRGLFTTADAEGNDAILSKKADNEFNSDVAVVINANNDNVYWLGTKSDIERFRQWKINNNASKVVDENGEPLVVYHGTNQEFNIFDITKGGKNTGLNEYTDLKTGEKVLVDSASTMFFSDSKGVAYSYGVIAAHSELSQIVGRIDNLLDLIAKKPLTRASLGNAYNKLLQRLTEYSEFNPRFNKLREYLEKVGERGLNELETEAFRQLLIEARRSIGNNYTALALSDWKNQLYEALKILKEFNNEQGIKRLLKGEVPLYLLNNAKYSSDNEDLLYFYVSDFINGKSSVMKYSTEEGLTINDRKVTSMTEKELKNTFNNLSKDLEITEQLHKLDQQRLIYERRIFNHGYFLNIRNPFIHDYEGSRLGLGYKGSTKYSTGYIESRQVKKALENRNDGVIYQNLQDPYLANNYGVFKSNQIKSAEANSGSFNRFNRNIYDEEPNGYLILNNALQKLASLHGITFNETSDAELNSEKWLGIIPDASLVNAFIYNGQIYINLDRANLDAPIHEMFHMFVGSLRFTNPSLYQALVDSTQSFPNYEQLVQEYPGRTRNDVNEEILVTELSKYLVGQPSSLASMDSATRYEISYNIKRMLDIILMGLDSVKTISEDRLFNLSLKEIAEEVNSAVMTNNFSGTFNVEGSELHRKLNNIKSDLYKEGTLEEYCD